MGRSMVVERQSKMPAPRIARGPVSSRHVNTIHLGGPSSHTLITFTSISPIGRYTRHSNMRTRIAALAACALCAVQGVLATEVWGVDMDSMIEKVRAVSGGYTASPRLLARLTGAAAKSWIARLMDIAHTRSSHCARTRSRPLTSTATCRTGGECRERAGRGRRADRPGGTLARMRLSCVDSAGAMQALD